MTWHFISPLAEVSQISYTDSGSPSAFKLDFIMPNLSPFLINYDDPDEPRFTGQFVQEPPDFSGSIKVITYNIDFGEDIDIALAELAEYEELHHPDIVLLQEMDEAGVRRMAEIMQYDFVYYPASVHRHGRNFGNAILTPWPLRNDRKVILPHRSPLNRQMRISLAATITVNGLDILTHCSHTEVYMTTRRLRNAQVGAITDDIGTDLPHVIVGGDFNTVTKRGIRRMVEQFGSIGLTRASKGAGPTVSKYGFNPCAADHIFTRGMEVIACGAIRNTKASDHYPVWVTLSPRANEFTA